MSEQWQPARIVAAHGQHPFWENNPIHKKVIRIRGIDESEVGSLMVLYREAGCQAHEWFCVRPEDHGFSGTMVLCEHEVLTD